MNAYVKKLIECNSQQPGHIIVLDASLTEESMDERPEGFLASRLIDQANLVVVVRDGRPSVLKNRYGT